ncbi:MAG TPA: pathogenicity locus [Actinobacteria bacterium]|nr:pathogenicity locus [Actinomycetota bacterium]
MNSIKDLRTIPGVGKNIAQNLVDIGIKKVADLKNRDPETLYENLSVLRGQHIDRCVLYVFRCAVYFASEKQHDPYLLKWWHWKDTNRG